MSSQGESPLLAKDPENDLLGRFDLRRLTAEEVRDSILAVSGNLNLAKTEGPSVFPVIPPEVLAGQSIPGNGWGKSTPEEAAARSVYVHIKRSLAVPLLSVFDSPDPDAPCPVRFNTTQPTQALGMLNGTFVNGQAKLFAESVSQGSRRGRAVPGAPGPSACAAARPYPAGGGARRAVHGRPAPGTSSRPRRRCGVSACWP